MLMLNISSISGKFGGYLSLVNLTRYTRMFGSTQLLSLWPSLSCSPILRRFTYSPLVLGMFERHHHLFGLADAKSKRQPFYQLVPSLGSFLPDVFGQSLLKPQNLSVAPPLSTVPLGHLSAIYPHSPASPQTTDTIPGLLVLHIRRGDFAQHCINLVEWGAEFNAFNSFEDIRQRDRFDVAATGGTSPPGEEPAPPEGELEFAARVDEMSKEEKERSKKAYKESLESYASAKRDYDKRKAKYEAAKINYLKRCYPDIDQIVKHVREIRNTVSAEEFPSKSRSTAPLTHIYVMTNGKPPFLAKLRAAFKSDAIIPNDLNLPPWESIYTSRDLELGWEEGYVAQALDMYIAQRADVFVGNGFSSLTSNIVMLRMANGVESVKTRL
ncbi:hypothetical protein BDP27DRAFT_515634 [Rhodocollybia butyracea]|uniref:Uncharacterized protein n=1 Tax=Rhodocollybia butyracea TaxID=206335 RepID=A0A9P5PBR3_9AGAR|nr:hypothetical protein BDP27DRAFT_515634 [Rhodocollybia butyracea]